MQGLLRCCGRGGSGGDWPQFPAVPASCVGMRPRRPVGTATQYVLHLSETSTCRLCLYVHMYMSMGAVRARGIRVEGTSGCVERDMNLTFASEARGRKPQNPAVEGQAPRGASRHLCVRAESERERATEVSNRGHVHFKNSRPPNSAIRLAQGLPPIRRDATSVRNFIFSSISPI